MVHISTDFVFNGRAYRPYHPGDPTDPLGVYGASKLAGEKNCLAALDEDNLTIVRTAWVYSSHGNNFVKTMLRLMAEKEQVGVVADQVGTPTWAFGLAGAVWQIVQRKISGIYHWTNAGVAGWYDFACAIQEEALNIGLLNKEIPVVPLRTEEYPTLAIRPAYSVLDKSELWQKIDKKSEHWRVSLRKMLKELKNG
jgi:dTDP-4-dehydrorhamnose reductase